MSNGGSILMSVEALGQAFHADLINLLKRYYFVGGMPEAVKCFSETGEARETRVIQQEIIKSYVLDFAKHAPAADIPKLTIIWESIPKHLAKENKKFIFSAVKKGTRSREYENALAWLEDAGLIYRVNAVETCMLPLKHYADHNCFKVYALDLGLLGAMANSPLELLVKENASLMNMKEPLLKIMLHSNWCHISLKRFITGEAKV